MLHLNVVDALFFHLLNNLSRTLFSFLYFISHRNLLSKQLFYPDNPDRTPSQITENNIISQEEAFVSNFAIYAFQMQYGCNFEPLDDYTIIRIATFQ